MKTSQEWYDGIKNDKEKLDNWLKNQYHGEVTAAERIRELILCYTPEQNANNWKSVVEQIAKEEEIHAQWVGELLRARGIEPERLQKEHVYYQMPL